MPSKKSSSQNSKSITQDFLVKQFHSFKADILSVVNAKIDYARKDMREHMGSTAAGLNRNIEGLSEKVSKLDLKVEAIHDNVKFIREDVKEMKQKLDSIVEKVAQHDGEISALKETNINP